MSDGPIQARLGTRVYIFGEFGNIPPLDGTKASYSGTWFAFSNPRLTLPPPIVFNPPALGLLMQISGEAIKTVL